jgi:hypothetical protein
VRWEVMHRLRMARPARERVEGAEEERRRFVSEISVRDSRERRWIWVVAKVEGESRREGMLVCGVLVVDGGWEWVVEVG